MVCAVTQWVHVFEYWRYGSYIKACQTLLLGGHVIGAGTNFVGNHYSCAIVSPFLRITVFAKKVAFGKGTTCIINAMIPVVLVKIFDHIR